MTTYNPTQHRTLVARPGEQAYKFYAVNKLLVDMAAAGIITLVASVDEPGNTDAIWLDLADPEIEGGTPKAYSGASWVTLTRELFGFHITNNSPGFVTDAELGAGLAGKQPLDAELTAIAELSSAANKLAYFTGAGTAALTDLSAFARTLLDDPDAATMRTTLGAGDVAGPASATGNAIARFDGTTGKLIKNSGVVVDGFGRIGIGTASPSSELHLATAGSPTIRLEQAGTTPGLISQAWSGVGSVEMMSFGFTGATNLLNIFEDGRVGVGTATPGAKLDVNGSIRTLAGVGESTGLNPSLRGGGSSPNIGELTWGDGTGLAMRFGPMVSGSFAPRVTFVDVGGVRFHTYGAGTLVTDSSGNITASSDAAIKEDIAPYTAGLDAVLALEPVTWTYTIASGLDRLNRYAGLIAQSVEEHIPEAIGEGDDGLLTIQDRPIIAALINAIKEQQTLITNLTARVTAMEAA